MKTLISSFNSLQDLNGTATMEALEFLMTGLPVNIKEQGGVFKIYTKSRKDINTAFLVEDIIDEWEFDNVSVNS